MTSRSDATWRLLGVVLTDACNLRCAYCRLPQEARRYLRWESLRPSLDALLESAADNVEVTFTGGEPLLAFATLRNAVSYVEQRIGRARVCWRLLTNGLLLHDEKLSFLDAHGFLVHLSFDGVPAAQALRGAPTYARLDRLLGDIRERYVELFRERLNVCLTLSPATIPYLSACVEDFLHRGISAFSITPAIGALEWEPARIVELEAQFDILSAALHRHYDSTGEVPFVSFRKSAPDSDEALSAWSCLVAEGQSPTIDVDGRVYACLRATATYQPAPAAIMRPAIEALGLGPSDAGGFGRNVATMREAAIATGAFQHPERRYSSYRKCADCEYLGRCRICPLACASVPGWDDMYRVPDFLCAYNQVELAHREKFPCQPTAADFLSGRVPLSAFPGSRRPDIISG